ncbi:MAG: hypothetical protein HQK51_09465 [Oligoflexia bacterium]|nr:hypothetical protein [Oligoflexia bacterium]
MKLLLSLFIILTLQSCSSSNYKFYSTDEIQKKVNTNTTTLDSYMLEGGSWVNNQPLYVNRDFDFAMAMSLEMIGPAIAAGKRISDNQESAKLLQTMPEINLSAKIKKYFSDYQMRYEQKDNLSNKDKIPVKMFGLLYGGDKARLLSILEVDKDKGNHAEEKAKNNESISSLLANNIGTQKDMVLRVIQASKELPLTGETSWTAGEGTNIQKFLEQSAPRLVSLFWSYQSNFIKENSNLALPAKIEKLTLNQDVQCSLGGNLILKGKNVSKDQKTYVFVADNMPNTLISCDR